MTLSKLLLPLIAIVSQAPVFADGGTVQLRKEGRTMLITVFTAPSPVSVGPADISVLLQDRNGLEPILDADVSVQLRSDVSGLDIQSRLTRPQAQNKLLYAAPVTLSEAGEWELAVTVFRNGERTDAAGKMDVAPAPAKAVSYWSYLAFPPLMIALFVVRERLIMRKAKG